LTRLPKSSKPISGSGREKYYLLLPRDCVNRIIAGRQNVQSIEVDGDLITLMLHVGGAGSLNVTHLFYNLSYKMEFVSPIPNSDYHAAHRLLEGEGKLDHPFSEHDLRAQASNSEGSVGDQSDAHPSGKSGAASSCRLGPIRYWDGERFVTTPTRNKYWEKR